MHDRCIRVARVTGAIATRPLALSPFTAGDPVQLGPEIGSAADLGRALALEDPGGPAVVELAPGVVLVHWRTASPGAVTVRWVNLSPGPAWPTPGGPVTTAIALVGPVGESATVVRLVGTLKACLAQPGVLEHARAATRREELVRALTAQEDAAGESRLAAADVLALLRSTADGLPAAESAHRQRAAGPNRIEQVRRRPLAARFLEQFRSFFAVLLWIGGVLAFLAGMPELGWAIFAVVAINGTFSFFQEYRAERAVEALRDLLPHHIAVRRGGEETQVPTAELVPGDVVGLEEGAQVPADGQLLGAAGLRIDQSTLTGESRPVSKGPTPDDDGRIPRVERPELIFAGTGVVAGSGTFVVTATGMATEIGTIARLTQSVPEEPSPLQREMVRVTRIVTALAVAFGAGFFLLGVATGSLRVQEALVFGLGVIVANVPEGLLPTLTLALALGVQRMARGGSLLKRLSSVETLGATTVICTDKTGTLTENRMAPRAAWCAGRTVSLDDARPSRSPELAELLEAAVLASHARNDHGDPTELALLAAATRYGVDPDTLRAGREIVATYAFDAFRKRMTLVRTSGGSVVAYVKGAPRETLALCVTVRGDGTTHALTDAHRRAILADHDRLATQGLRILAVAKRSLPGPPETASAAAVERELTFLGLVALWDPPRPEVKDAVRLCRRAGIRVIVVSGDYGLTAAAIAREIGLPVDRVVTGEELARLPSEARSVLVAQPDVLFARTSPAHKLAIVSALKERGEVVTVTGDGVNDAPALKAADIGVAMGRRGSDVAKEAAVMVITDDNFASIVAAVRQGRAIYANVGKFITYIFASNVPELVPFLAFVLVGIPLPLTVMQILAVDLGTDLLPALALGAEAPEPGIMDHPPRPRDQHLLGARRLLHAYGFLGVAEAALALVAYFWTYWLAGWRPGLPMDAAGELYQRATTMTLAGIVASQVGNVLACRAERESLFRVGILTNRGVLLGIAAEIGLLVAMILIPPVAWVFGLAPLHPAEWSLLLVFPLVILGLEEARKCVVRAVAARGRLSGGHAGDSGADVPRRGRA